MGHNAVQAGIAGHAGKTTMKLRRVLTCVAGVVVVLAAVVAFAMIQPESPKVVGLEPGNYSGVMIEMFNHAFEDDKMMWLDDRGCISVGFGEEGKVVWKEFWVVGEASFIDKLRHWLGLP